MKLTLAHLSIALALAGLAYVTSPANAAPLEQQCGYELRGTLLFRTSCDGAGTTERSVNGNTVHAYPAGSFGTNTYVPPGKGDGCGEEHASDQGSGKESKGTSTSGWTGGKSARN